MGTRDHDEDGWFEDIHPIEPPVGYIDWGTDTAGDIVAYIPDSKPDEPLEFSIIGLCYRCTQPVGYWEGRLTDTSWDEERCWPHDDPTKTHIVGQDIMAIAQIHYGADRPAAVWNALAALVRAERVNSGLHGSHVKSASRLLAAGRVEA